MSPTSDAGMVLLAAMEHPDAAVQTRIWNDLYRYLESLHPRWSIEAVAEHLSGATGTVLEPFRLSPDGLRVAAYLGALAFSDMGSQSRFRTVSEETIGIDGGLVVTNNLRSYYVERYAFGFRRRSPKAGWFVAPAKAPQLHGGNVQRAKLQLTDTGFRLLLPVGPFQQLGDLHLTALHTHVLGSERHEPLAVSLVQNAAISGYIGLATTTPEEMIQWSALMERQAILVVCVGDADAACRWYLRLRPELLEEDTAPVLYAGVELLYSNWIRVTTSLAAALSQELKVDIARWCGIPSSWTSASIIDGAL